MLETLFSPGTVAVVGASTTPGKVGHAILANLISAGFEGTIVPINPKAKELLGKPCWPR
jgi:acetyltransferase